MAKEESCFSLNGDIFAKYKLINWKHINIYQHAEKKYAENCKEC